MWTEATPAHRLHLSAVTIGEIQAWDSWLPGDRPVLEFEFRHGKVGEVRRGQRRSYTDSRGSDEAICLVEGDSTVGVGAPPTARTLSLGGAERSQAQPSHKAAGSVLLLGPQASPDFLNRDGTHPWLDTGSAKSPDAFGSGPSAQTVDQHGGIEEEP